MRIAGWLAGGVSLNDHTLNDFRTGHGEALDHLFTQVIATLVQQGLVDPPLLGDAGVAARRAGSSLGGCLIVPQPVDAQAFAR